MLHPLVADDVCRTRHTVHVRNLCARDELRFRLVGYQHVEVAQERVGQGVCRCRIEDDLCALLLGYAGGIVNRAHRSLQLHQQDTRFGNGLCRAVNVGRKQLGIGSRGYGNAVFTLRIHHDEGYARRILAIHHHVARLYPLGLILLDGPLAEGVVSHLGHKGDVSAQSGCRHGLVGSLPAGVHEELPSDERLTRQGQALHVDHHIGVATSYDYYFLIHTHCYIIRLYILRQDTLPPYVTKGWGKCSKLLILIYLFFFRTIFVKNG